MCKISEKLRLEGRDQVNSIVMGDFNSIVGGPFELLFMFLYVVSVNIFHFRILANKYQVPFELKQGRGKSNFLNFLWCKEFPKWNISKLLLLFQWKYAIRLSVYDTMKMCSFRMFLRA